MTTPFPPPIAVYLDDSQGAYLRTIIRDWGLAAPVVMLDEMGTPEQYRLLATEIKTRLDQLAALCQSAIETSHFNLVLMILKMLNDIDVWGPEGVIPNPFSLELHKTQPANAALTSEPKMGG